MCQTITMEPLCGGHLMDHCFVSAIWRFLCVSIFLVGITVYSQAAEINVAKFPFSDVICKCSRGEQPRNGNYLFDCDTLLHMGTGLNAIYHCLLFIPSGGCKCNSFTWCICSSQSRNQHCHK